MKNDKARDSLQRIGVQFTGDHLAQRAFLLHMVDLKDQEEKTAQVFLCCNYHYLFYYYIFITFIIISYVSLQSGDDEKYFQIFHDGLSNKLLSLYPYYLEHYYFVDDQFA